MKRKLLLENRKNNCTPAIVNSNGLSTDNQVSVSKNSVISSDDDPSEKVFKQVPERKRELRSVQQKICLLCKMCRLGYAQDQMLLMEACKHRICKKCARFHFTACIRQKEIRDVVCPICREPKLTNIELMWRYFSSMNQVFRNILDEDVYDRLESKLRDFVLDMDPSVRKCPNCQFRCFTDTDGRRLCCGNCSVAFCIQCGKEWKSQHDGVSCEEFSKLISGVIKYSKLNIHKHRRSEKSKKQMSVISKEVDSLEKTVLLKAKQRIFTLIIQEIIHTEEAYIKNLNHVISNYVPELMGHDVPKPFIGKQNLIFANIKEIHAFHESLLPKLKLCELNAAMIGQCFLDHEFMFLSLYLVYNANVPNSNKFMIDYGSAFFERKQRELGDCMGLSSYLIKPVQKLGQYPLFFAQFLSMIKKGDPENESFLKAKKMLEATLTRINDFLRMDQGLSRFGIHLADQGALLNLNEFLVWHGTSGNSHALLVFLFEKLILFVVKKPSAKNEQPQYQHKYSIKMRDVIQIFHHKENDTKFKLYWYCNNYTSDNFTLQAQTSAIRNKWISAVSGLLLQRFCKSGRSRVKSVCK